LGAAGAYYTQDFVHTVREPGVTPKIKLRSLAKVEWTFVFGCAAYDLLRIPKLKGQKCVK
jgi:hypothetical protein